MEIEEAGTCILYAIFSKCSYTEVSLPLPTDKYVAVLKQFFYVLSMRANLASITVANLATVSFKANVSKFEYG